MTTRPKKAWTWRTAIAAGGTAGLLMFGIGPANTEPTGDAQAGGQDELAPPPQLSGLDFLLGTFDCTQPGQRKLEVTMATTRDLGGHYYTMDISQYMEEPVPDIHGRAAYGWNPVNGEFMMQYHDNWGTSATATSPGWEDDQLRFHSDDYLQVLDPNPTGEATGVQLIIDDAWKVVNKNRYQVSQTVTYPDGTSTTGELDCRRR